MYLNFLNFITKKTNLFLFNLIDNIFIELKKI